MPYMANKISNLLSDFVSYITLTSYVILCLKTLIIVLTYLLNCIRRRMVRIFLVTNTTSKIATDVSETKPPGATLR